MATKKKMLQAAAGSAGGAGLDITEVFSTYLYAGTSAEHTITNGIDLAGEGGMIWGKIRSSTDQHWIVDSERGAGSNSNYKYVMPNLATSELDFASRSVSSFNSNGFTLQNGTDKQFNESGQDYASWTFRKAPKFFDVVTYTGDGVTGREIPHSLGSDVGLLIIKCTSASNFWFTHHISRPSGALFLDSTDAETTGSTKYYMGNDVSVIQPTSTHFTVGGSTAGTMVNGSGETYVAYLFAHNDGDGGFGPDGDQDIIKCGSYTSSNPSNRPEVDLGFEPQWLLIKNATASSNWMLVDNMRGLPVNSQDQTLAADSSAAENGVIGSPNAVALTPTGFNLTAGVTASNAGTGNTHIYMAIRRGPLAQPESGTEVFAPVFHNDDTSEINVSGGFTADAFISKLRSGTDTYMTPRLLGGQTLRPSSTAGEVGYSNFVAWDTQEGVNFTGWWGAVNDGIDWQFKRSPGFFDVVAYSGNSTAGNTVSHNLGVAPEMIWVKKRNAARAWKIYHSATGSGKAFEFDSATAASSPAFWNNTNPTESAFTLGSSETVNGTGDTYISYHFATLPGVSKVGSFTGNGTSQDINCGFTSGARFVLLKRTDSSGTWFILDSERGIVAGNDAILRPNTATAEDNNYDIIDPLSSGFTINYVSAYNMNASGATYIFYAIA